MTSDLYSWDERVETWEEVATSEAFLAIRDRIVEVAAPRADDRVVDLGAGTGHLALPLAPRVGELGAVDISERTVERLDIAAVVDGVDDVETVVGNLNACRSTTSRRRSSSRTTPSITSTMRPRSSRSPRRGVFCSRAGGS